MSKKQWQVELKDWVKATGAVAMQSSAYHEIQSIIEDAVKDAQLKDKERLLEGVTTKKVRYGSSLEDVDKGYNQALEDIKQLIKEIYE